MLKRRLSSLTFSIDPFPERRHLSNERSGAHKKNMTDNNMMKHISPFFRTIHRACAILRFIVFDGMLFVLFTAFVFSDVLHKLHDDFFHPQLQLMLFQVENRQFTDTTYYHRVCDKSDFTATTPDELMIGEDFSTEDSVEHMLIHGVSIYPNLLTNETSSNLREWIASENHRREGWNVIENQNRYTWGIDVNMHPNLQTFWEELAASKQFVNGLEAIVGPDPAIIEFTAITSSYGAEDQYMHADVMPSASAVKYARSFVPSYSLFIPLQDTTYEMGATHVCPGSHLCSEADDICDEDGAFAVSGEVGDVWSMGNGAFLNQQTYHKGMGFTQKGAIDRVVLIATFAPRPNFRHGVETRQIGQGGSYSLLWHQWGHTFSDFLHSDKRMTEPQKTFRSLGIIKGNGWNYLSTLSMRMANEDTEMRRDDLEEFLEEEGGLWFLPMSWQDVNEFSDISDWHAYGIGVLKRIKLEFKRYYFIGMGVYASTFFSLVMLQRVLGIGKVSKQSRFNIALRFVFRIIAIHGVIIFLARYALNTIEDSYWAKSIRSRKLYRIPVAESNNPASSTIPHKDDILFVPHYSSEYLASYARVVYFAHPGNSYWRTITKTYAAPYASLTKSLKEDFCATLVVDITEGRRFLKQDEERFWTEVISIDELIKVCHKDLSTAINPLLESLLSQIDSLQSETKFGKFRGTEMQSKIIPQYLQKWDKILFRKRLETDTYTQSLSTKRTPLLERNRSRRAIHFRTRVESMTTSAFNSRFRRQALPRQPPRKEPYFGAWLKEGDRVSALFRCNEESDRWFAGIITAAIPNDGTYDIAYDDGDIDEGLSIECVERL